MWLWLTCLNAVEQRKTRVYVSSECSLLPWVHSSSSVCSARGSCWFRGFVGSVCKCWAHHSSTRGLGSHSLRRKQQVEQQDYRERSEWWISEVRYMKAHSISQLHLVWLQRDCKGHLPAVSHNTDGLRAGEWARQIIWIGSVKPLTSLLRNGNEWYHSITDLQMELWSCLHLMELKRWGDGQYLVKSQFKQEMFASIMFRLVSIYTLLKTPWNSFIKTDYKLVN